MIPTFQVFAAKLGQQFALNQTPTPEQLQTIAAELLALCQTTVFSAEQYPAAEPGKEQLHALAVSDSGGPSVYLVSDGVGVTSPPHEHQTWAVIVGLRGVERNIQYGRLPGEQRSVAQQGIVDVGAGAYWCLAESDIHATDVVGDQPTYHVHLYGRALAALPAFAQRCFVVQALHP